MKKLYLLISLGLVVLNILTLTSATIHNALYKALNMLPVSSLMADSPTNRHAKKLKLTKQKQLANKKIVKSLSKRITARTIKNTTRNIAAVPFEAVPYFGVASMLALTIGDVKDACETMKDMDAMTKAFEIHDEVDETKVCGQTVPGKDVVMSKIKLTKDEYFEIQRNLGGFLYDSKQQTGKKIDEFNRALGDIVYHIWNEPLFQ